MHRARRGPWRCRKRARASRGGRAWRDAAAQSSVGGARAVGRRSGGGHANARRRHRLRDHRQRCDGAVRRRRGSEGARGGAHRIRRHRRSARPARTALRRSCRVTRIARAQREMASAIAHALQRWRHRAARGGHRRRQVARLSAPRAALGGGERRADGRVDEHDQPAGAARRQGSPVSARRAYRSAGALRAAQGMAQLSLPLSARAGVERGAGTLRQRYRERARGDSCVVRAHRGWLARGSRGAAARGGVGRGGGGVGSLSARSSARSSTSAFSSRRDVWLRRRT